MLSDFKLRTYQKMSTFFGILIFAGSCIAGSKQSLSGNKDIESRQQIMKGQSGIFNLLTFIMNF